MTDTLDPPDGERCPHDGAKCHHLCKGRECWRESCGMYLSLPWEGYPLPGHNHPAIKTLWEHLDE
jgi:hypothetical protein